MDPLTFGSDPLIRLAWALAIIAAGLLLYRALNSLLLARASRNTRSPAEDALPGIGGGQPAILYFTTPECAPCRTIQRPALQRLQERLGDRLRVVEINAAERPDIASRWGVLSVPTTFIIDGSGKLHHVNHGATRAEKLLQQVEKIL